MPPTPTVRERLESIRALVGSELARDTVMNIVLLHRIHEDAVAALATLDDAKRNTYFDYPHGRSECRLVPDPLVPRLDANPNTKEDA